MIVYRWIVNVSCSLCVLQTNIMQIHFATRSNKNWFSEKGTTTCTFCRYECIICVQWVFATVLFVDVCRWNVQLDLFTARKTTDKNVMYEKPVWFLQHNDIHNVSRKISALKWFQAFRFSIIYFGYMFLSALRDMCAVCTISKLFSLEVESSFWCFFFFCTYWPKNQFWNFTTFLSIRCLWSLQLNRNQEKENNT